MNLFVVIINVCSYILIYMCFNCSLKWWSMELLILLSGILPNPKLETSVLSIWYILYIYLDQDKSISETRIFYFCFCTSVLTAVCVYWFWTSEQHDNINVALYHTIWICRCCKVLFLMEREVQHLYMYNQNKGWQSWSCKKCIL